jgi:hypothetical protein
MGNARACGNTPDKSVRRRPSDICLVSFREVPAGSDSDTVLETMSSDTLSQPYAAPCRASSAPLRSPNIPRPSVLNNLKRRETFRRRMTRDEVGAVEGVVGKSTIRHIQVITYISTERCPLPLGFFRLLLGVLSASANGPPLFLFLGCWPKERLFGGWSRWYVRNSSNRTPLHTVQGSTRLRPFHHHDLSNIGIVCQIKISNPPRPDDPVLLCCCRLTFSLALTPRRPSLDFLGTNSTRGTSVSGATEELGKILAPTVGCLEPEMCQE